MAGRGESVHDMLQKMLRIRPLARRRAVVCVLKWGISSMLPLLEGDVPFCDSGGERTANSAVNWSEIKWVR
jgi:hypothetical protein